ncbi:MAG TPA: M90 family metallopeptidase [Verrucomicrobiae bacterium]|nr:M90 family metallopeptidase [Verrucomicrobiae bacterium]
MVVFVLLIWGSRRRLKPAPLPDNYQSILEQYVPFYERLDKDGKTRFEARMKQFLANVRLTGIGTEVEDLDRVFIAASAVIPLYHFPNWEYTNLNEVLLYPNSFDEEYRFDVGERYIAGIVGEGPLQNQMVLSKRDIRWGFMDKEGTYNTAIHEFVHLIDKTDGYTDGVPENLINQKFILPWLDLMHRKIREIEEGNSDIHPYGATNRAEFFAVASEYFFERPDLLQERHPELYALLEKIFHPQPGNAGNASR